MAEVCGALRAALGLIFITGCVPFKALDFDSRPTRIDPLPVKAAIKDSAVLLSFPVKTVKKPTGGYRSVIDIQADIRLSEPAGVDVPLIPNGLALGVRVRK